MRYAAFVASRAMFHLRTLGPALWRAAVWWWRGNRAGHGLWTFLGAAALFNLGLFIFILLYNLYLLDRGYREDFLGLVTGCMTAGSIAGVLPAGAMPRRFGLRRTLVGCFAGTALVSAARAVVGGQAALLASAFLGGMVLSLWPVSIAPVIAGLTTERNRAFGFSLFFASGIGMGVVGGLTGGKLPAFFAHWGAAGSKQMALLVSCGVSALAAWPALSLRFSEAPAAARSIYPWNSFLRRYLIAMAVWNLATGSFNPFFNAYFAHLHVPVERIGAIFSATQAVQVVAILIAPVVLRRLGLVRGIAGMQLVTGMALICLAAGPAGRLAVLAYASYMSFQWMSEPGMYSLLMNHVGVEERAGASALNYLVIFSAQAIAAAGAGAAVARFGYAAALAAAAMIALLAALLFRVLLGPRARSSPASVPDSA